MANSSPARDAALSWWFDDVTSGLVMRHPGGRTFADADQLWLAWITGNASDVHGNTDAAARGPFGEVVVLGALSASVVIGLAQPADGPPATLHWVPPAWHRISLPFAVRVRDSIRAVSTFQFVGESDVSGGEVHRLIQGLNQDDVVVVEIEEVIWVPKKPPRSRTKDF